LLTRRQDARAGYGPQQHIRLARCRTDTMLAVIEHQQEPASAQRSREPLGCPGCSALQAQGRIDRARDEIGIGQGRELGEPYALRKRFERGARDLETEPRLAY